MSYCRWGESDMYIFDHVDLGLVCFACPDMPSEEVESTLFNEVMTEHDHFVAGYDFNKMLEHVDMHRKQGYHIPITADERLIRDRDCVHEYHDDVCILCFVHKDRYEQFN